MTDHASTSSSSTNHAESFFIAAYREDISNDSVLPSASRKVPAEKALEIAKDLIYTHPVARQLSDLSDDVSQIKTALLAAGLPHLDNGIDEFHTQILPKEGDIDMARLRARLDLGQNTVMISADTIQALVEKAASMAVQSIKEESEKQKKTIPTFREFASDWLEHHCRLKVDKTTFVGYRSYLNAHLYGTFGDLRLDEITVQRLQEYITNRWHLQEKTLRNHTKLLSLILQAAMEEEYITKDVTKSKQLVYPPKNPKEREPLTEEQLKDVLQNIPKLKPTDQYLLALMIYTGARRGEVLGLKSMDIDWAAGMIHLRRQVRYPSTNQGEIVEYLKMHKKQRDIPILDQLKPFLPNDSENRLIFGDGVNPISQQQYRNTWERIRKTINLYGATAHILRHTFLTYSNNHGADPKSLQALAGHSSAAFTLKQYVHSQAYQLLRVGENISTAFGQL